VGEVAAEADIIITCLPSTAALREVVRELKQAPRWGQIVVTAARDGTELGQERADRIDTAVCWTRAMEHEAVLCSASFFWRLTLGFT